MAKSKSDSGLSFLNEIWYYLTELDKKQGQAIYLYLDDDIRKT